MKTIIATFGEEPGGIIASIKQNGCEKLILLIPDNLSAKGARGLEKTENTAKQMEIKVQKIKVSPYSIMENINKIKELVSAQDGSEVILNVTGGRKPLSLAATLAAFVANPQKIIYVQEENDQSIEIPRFTIGEKLLSEEKRAILKSIKNNTSIEQIKNSLKGKNNNSTEYHAIMKHLRELGEMGLVETSDGRPHTYTITPSGELVR